MCGDKAKVANVDTTFKTFGEKEKEKMGQLEEKTE